MDRFHPRTTMVASDETFYPSKWWTSDVGIYFQIEIRDTRASLTDSKITSGCIRFASLDG